MNKLNIAFFSIMFREINGTAKATRKLAFALAKLGHNIEIFAPNKPKEWDRHPLTENMTWHNIFSLRAAYEQDVRLCFPLLRGARKHKFPHLDVVHAATPEGMGTYGIFVAKKNSIPKVVTAHSPLFYYTEDFLGKVPAVFLNPILEFYEPYYYNRFDMISVPTRSKKDFILNQGMKDPILVLSNGIEDIYFDQHAPDIIREKYKTGDKKLLVYASRMAPEKNPCAVVRMFKEIHGRFPNCHLFLVGAGPEVPKIRALIKNLGLKKHVTQTGFVEFEELLDFYAAADLTCLWSWVEAQGLVLLEAMAQGTPCIGYDGMGIQDVIVDGKTGYLASTEDEFIEKTVALFENDQLLKTMAANARQVAEHHRMERIAKAWVEIYKLAIDIYPMIDARAPKPSQIKVWQDFVEFQPDIFL